MTLVLFDVSSLMYRAFHTLSPDRFARPSDGLANNCVYGVASMTLSLLSKFRREHGDIHPVACFDSPTCNRSRTAVCKDYKSNRPPCPSKMSHQFEWTRDLYRSLGISQAEVGGYEADDIIASYAHSCTTLYKTIIIVSPDKDLCQLVGNNVCIYNPKTKIYIHSEQVLEKFGVTPRDFILYQSLIGDKVDGIAGVPQIGPKTAVSIINACNGDLAVLVDHPKKSVVEQHKDTIEKNRKLVTLFTGISIDQPLAFDPCSNAAAFDRFLDTLEIQSKALRKYLCNK